jgi:E3 ubiquitin-protein ligase HUWE1
MQRFTKGSCNQAKLLRIIKCIDYISYNSTTATSATATTATVVGTENVFGFTTTPTTTTTLNKKGGYTDDLLVMFTLLNQVLQESTQIVYSSLLPVIECIMILCKYPLYASSSSSDSTSTTTTTSDNNSLLFSFTEKNKKILNALVRQNPKLLKGSFALLVRNPKVLEFDNKRMYFNQHLHKKPSDYKGQIIHVNVRRQYIFQDSYYQLQNRLGKELKYGKLSIR